MRDGGVSFEGIAQYLKDNGYKTLSGRGSWHAQTIQRLYIDN